MSQQESPFKLQINKLGNMEVPPDIFRQFCSLCRFFLNKLFSLNISRFDKILIFILIMSFLSVCTVAIICYSGNGLPGRKFPI